MKEKEKNKTEEIKIKNEIEKENEIENKAKDPFKTFIRILEFMKYEKALFIIGISLLVVSTITIILNNLLFQPLIDSIISNETENFYKYGILMVVTLLTSIISDYLGVRTLSRMAQKIVYRIRGNLYNHLQGMSVEFFEKRKDGDIMSIYINDVSKLTTALDQGIPEISIAIFQFIAVVIAMFYIHSGLAMINTVLIFITIVILFLIIKNSNKYFVRAQVNMGKLNAFTEEMFTGQKVVNMYNYNDRSEERFEEVLDKYTDIETKANTYGGILMPFANGVTLISDAIILSIGAVFTIMGQISLGGLTAFNRFTSLVKEPVVNISQQMPTLLQALAGAERIFEILDAPQEKDEGTYYIEEIGNTKFWTDGKDRTQLKGKVEFLDVSFSYEKEKKVLENISFYAKPGQKIALVGSTGAGKTTISNLLTRFYDIDDGYILIDGININEIKKDALRSIIGMVLQDINLFEGSIKDNIALGKPDADENEILKSINYTELNLFTDKLKQGIDTPIEEENNILSQGERQLISIARAAISEPEILILDEATSSVDTVTERKIAEGMDKLMENRTTIVIAHRLSTVRDADCILVIEDGKIIERGTHDELMVLEGHYYKLNTGSLSLI